MKRSIETHRLEWRGITVKVSYEEKWLGSDGPYSTAHLQVEALSPERAVLPITETGYRSHFTSAADIDAEGGPVAFVLAWLDAAASKPEWKKQEEEARQFSLF